MWRQTLVLRVFICIVLDLQFMLYLRINTSVIFLCLIFCTGSGQAHDEFCLFDHLSVYPLLSLQTLLFGPQNPMASTQSTQMYHEVSGSLVLLL